MPPCFAWPGGVDPLESSSPLPCSSPCSSLCSSFFGFFFGLGWRRWRRAVHLVDEPRRDFIDARAHRRREVGVLDGGLQLVGGVGGATGVASVQIGRDAVAQLGEVPGRVWRDGRALRDGRIASRRPSRRRRGQRAARASGIASRTALNFPMRITRKAPVPQPYPRAVPGNRGSSSPAGAGSAGSRGRSSSARRARSSEPRVLRIRRWCRQRSQRPASGRLTARLRPRADPSALPPPLRRLARPRPRARPSAALQPLRPPPRPRSPPPRAPKIARFRPSADVLAAALRALERLGQLHDAAEQLVHALGLLEGLVGLLAHHLELLAGGLHQVVRLLEAALAWSAAARSARTAAETGQVTSSLSTWPGYERPTAERCSQRAFTSLCIVGACGTFRRLLGFLRPYRRQLIWSRCCSPGWRWG